MPSPPAEENHYRCLPQATNLGTAGSTGIASLPISTTRKAGSLPTVRKPTSACIAQQHFQPLANGDNLGDGTDSERERPDDFAHEGKLQLKLLYIISHAFFSIKGTTNDPCIFTLIITKYTVILRVRKKSVEV